MALVLSFFVKRKAKLRKNSKNQYSVGNFYDLQEENSMIELE